MRRIIPVLVIACVLVTPVSTQYKVQKVADELHRFESTWITAYLNSDRAWIDRFYAGKLNVAPSTRLAIEGRSEAVRTVIQTTLQPNEMKVRISGTISLLTSDANQNRSFYFLDTFNKIGGKWQVIASSISPTGGSETNGREKITQELVRSEAEWARAEAARDTTALVRVLGSDFVSTSADGTVRNREEWIASHNGGSKSSSRGKLEIRVLNDSLAIATGVDTTVRLDKDQKEIVHPARFTDTWSKNASGQWQCVASHSSSVR